MESRTSNLARSLMEGEESRAVAFSNSDVTEKTERKRVGEEGNDEEEEVKEDEEEEEEDGNE